jgi:hypothetical protein
MPIEADVVVEGRVVNGVVVLADGSQLPEGARVRLKVVAEADEDDPELDQLIVPDPSLPPDHPLAPYNREIELAILRASIEAMKAGEVGMPLEEAMAKIAAELNLPPVRPE